jgi:hypothetical protein
MMLVAMTDTAFELKDAGDMHRTGACCRAQRLNKTTDQISSAVCSKQVCHVSSAGERWVLHRVSVLWTEDYILFIIRGRDTSASQQPHCTQMCNQLLKTIQKALLPYQVLKEVYSQRLQTILRTTHPSNKGKGQRLGQ